MRSARCSVSLAFFSYRRKLPLAIRSVLYPILGDRIYGFWGRTEIRRRMWSSVCFSSVIST